MNEAATDCPVPRATSSTTLRRPLRWETALRIFPTREAPPKDGKDFFLIVRDFAARAETGGEMYFLGGAFDRVAVGFDGGVAALTRDYDRPRQMAGAFVGWADEPEPQTTERFHRAREYVGRAREVDRKARVFSAVLTGRYPEAEDDVLVTLDFEILDDAQMERLMPGAMFILVTGYRQTVNAHGRVLRSALDTRVFLQHPRPLSPRRRELAWDLADKLFDDE